MENIGGRLWFCHFWIDHDSMVQLTEDRNGRFHTAYVLDRNTSPEMCREAALLAQKELADCMQEWDISLLNALVPERIKYNADEAFLQAHTAAWGNLWDCRAALRKLVSSVYLESDLNLPFGKKRKILIPTWVYSYCVRHEENRSENCRIVFPQMGVNRMGYGYCNIIYGQIRQKSLIFFVYL